MIRSISGSILERFERVCQETPESIAVEEDAGLTSYAQLKGRSDAIAGWLLRRGVTREQRVVLFCERSAAAIAAMLGVWRVGAAYVPVDPDLPDERLWMLLADCGPVCVITSSPQLAARIRPRVSAVLDASLPLEEGPQLLQMSAAPLQAACVLYTSGSTGKPKGVVLTRGAVDAYAQTFCSLTTLSSRDCVYQFASLAFDGAIEEIFPALTVGARLTLRPPGPPEPFPAFLERLARSGVTVLDLPTAYWSQWMREQEPLGAPLPPAIRALVVYGEAAQLPTYQRWREYAPTGCTWFNTYGPTEATVNATSFSVAPGAALEEAPLIGRPLPGVQTYVMDEAFERASPGVPGELCLGGVGLARGYLGAAGLTAERFVPHPFAPGERLYRTGDRVVLAADGQLRFLGRADFQIKHRGFRVELGEIEAAIRQEVPAAEVVVLLRRDNPAAPVLVAYLSMAAEDRTTPVAVATALEKTLPPYMLPAAYVLMNPLPRTVSGKVDRARLPAPTPEDRVGGELSASPMDEGERRLAAVWSQLLGMEDIGRGENFFQVGGHSLLAGQLAARVREVFGVELSLLQIFQSPTLAAMSQAIAQSKPRSADPIPRADRSKPLPLSFSQERVWFIDQLAPGTAVYNASFNLSFNGPLDVEALGQAFTDLVARHEILRTSFHEEAGVARQRVHPPFPVAFHAVDLSALAPEAREQRVAALAAEQFRTPFKTDRLPLFRHTLMRLGPTEHVLIGTEHHFIHDGWSISVLMRDFQRLYDARAQGKVPDLPPLAIQFADYAAWHRARAQRGEFDALAKQARERYAGAPALELPTDRPRPRLQSFQGGEVRAELPEALYERLQLLAARRGVTLFNVTLSAFFVLLRRYCDQEDLLIGTTVAARTRVELESVIGMMVNSVPLRVAIRANPPFRELLQTVAHATADSFSRQELSFDQLVGALNPARDPSRTPIFQVDFSFHDTRLPSLDFRGARADIAYPPAESAKFDLNVTVVPRPRAVFMWEYCADLFDRSTIEKMVGHYQGLLEAFAANDELRVLDASLLSGSERAFLLAASNGPVSPGELSREGVQHVIARRAARAPDAVALIDGDLTLTYGELDRRSNRVARALAARGVGLERRVGVCLPRSWQLAVAALGVLKAGAAVVAVDPSHPQDRRAYALGNAGARLVFVRVPGEPSVCAELTVEECLAHSGDDGALCLPVEPAHLAYVLYTSGSTGRPKGVELTQGGLLNHATWHAERFGLRETDRVLQFNAVAFDTLLEELFPTWMTGGAVVLRTEAMISSAGDLFDAVERFQLTVLDLPTAYWHELVRELEARPRALPPSVRWVLIAGEAASAEALAAWWKRAGDRAPVVNLYGPTEISLICTDFEPSPQLPLDPAWQGVPIGKPIRNTRAYVLDAQLQPVPVGVPGELFIGGAGVARGYAGRVDLTAERFLPDLAGDGGRMYRTGDRVKRLPDGNLAFLGRRDRQVKLRGFRVELREIEAALCTHPKVAAAAVIHRDGRLLGYCVPREPRPSVAELVEHVRASLPEYMLPARWALLEKLPLTSTGKVDYGALPEPSPLTAQASAPPLDGKLQQMAKIWSEVLGVPDVPADADFFELGGHSLLATRLVWKVRNAFGSKVALNQVFEFPKLSDFCRECDKGDNNKRL